MRYVSNLVAPDLRPYFKLLEPPKQIMGHDIPSDPQFEPDCGFFSDDEAAILYHVAKQVGGTWIDVGARFGWTGAHLAEAGCEVVAIDPQLSATVHWFRLQSNITRKWIGQIKEVIFQPFRAALCSYPDTRGVVIDGCHDDPEPLNDAITAHSEIQGEGVIVLHDFWGAPIQRAVTWLMNMGYSCRIYNTPNGLAVCTTISGARFPKVPDHVPDPQFNWQAIRAERAPHFDFARCV